jgi:hypothetical protein
VLTRQPSVFDAAPVLGSEPSSPDISVHEISSPSVSLLALEESARGKQGTMLLKASDPPPRPDADLPAVKAAAPAIKEESTFAAGPIVPDPEEPAHAESALPDSNEMATRVKPRLTMPDLLPPTVREPVLIQPAKDRRVLLMVGGALVLVGVVGTLLVWLLFYRDPVPNKKPRKDGKSTPTAPHSKLDVPSDDDDVATVGATVPSEAASADASAAPPPAGTSQACQSAIFWAVTGDCDHARRSFGRCKEKSPDYASAARTVSGLCG